MTRSVVALVACLLAGCATAPDRTPPAAQPSGDPDMQLGNFSVSLSVKDIEASLDFYQKLGFEVLARPAPNYAILQNDTCTIGLFQGMFEGNILTFNPGWDRSAQPLAGFTDVREIQAELKRRGITPTVEADPASTGPASVIVVDPDGNQILLDQHVGKPGR